MSKIASCLLAGVALMPIAARAQQSAQPLSPIDVYAHRYSSDDGESSWPKASRRPTPQSFPATPSPISRRAPTMRRRRGATRPASIFIGAGGVSSLPVIHGLDDERNAVVLGGVPITRRLRQSHEPATVLYRSGRHRCGRGPHGQCPGQQGRRFHRRLDPRHAARAGLRDRRLSTGQGAAAPADGPFGPGVVASGSVSTSFRSNGGGIGVAGHVNVATEHFSLQYDGAWSKSGDYHAGGGAAGAVRRNMRRKTTPRRWPIATRTSSSPSVTPTSGFPTRDSPTNTWT